MKMNLRAFSILLAVVSLCFAGCGSDDSTSRSTDDGDASATLLDTLDSADTSASVDTLSTEDTKDEEDSFTPPPIQYSTPDLTGERTDSVLPALGDVAVQPAVAVGNAGQPVVVFAGTSDENSDLAIYVSSPGRPTAAVRIEPPGPRNEPSICRLSNGDFAAAWSYDGQGIGLPLGVEGAILAADGSVISTFDVKTEVEGNHWLGHVGCNPTGGFTITGSRTDTDDTTFGVFVQRYDNEGAAQGDAFGVNPSPDGTQVQPVVAIAPDGTGVVVYEDSPNDTNYVLTGRTIGDSAAESQAFTVLGSEGADALKPAIAISYTGQVTYAGNVGAQVQLMTVESLQTPEPGEAWLKTFGSFVFPAITYLSQEGDLALVSLMNVTGAGEPSVRVEILSVGNDVPKSSVSLGDDPKLPPYPPSIGYGGGILAVAWTQRTESGFEIHQSTFEGSVITD